MDLRLGLAQARERGVGPAEGDGRQPGPVEDRAHVAEVAMRLRALDAHVDAAGAEGAASRLGPLDRDALESEARRQRGERIERGAGVDERGERHVARGARTGVEPGEPHFAPVRLIRCAA